MKLPEEFIQVYNGSDGALFDICLTYLSPNDNFILFPPTYDNFRIFALSVGGKLSNIILPDAFTKDIEFCSNKITHSTKLVYICNPNNPTGICYFEDEIEYILVKHKNVLFVIDEAYVEFIDSSVKNLTFQT